MNMAGGIMQMVSWISIIPEWQVMNMAGGT